jgi:hypothetical protein
MLGATLSTLGLPKTAKNAIQYLLSRRILWPKGVISLLSVMLGSEDHGGDMLERYEQVTSLLSRPPRGTSPEVCIHAYCLGTFADETEIRSTLEM